VKARAVVFDLDGTLVDNMALHAEAFAEFMTRRGLPPLTSRSARASTASGTRTSSRTSSGASCPGKS
jgi:beta-phosphoglucomutase-like phosphatase (HAD superfamily)